MIFLGLGRKRLAKVTSHICYFYSKKRKEASLGRIAASFNATQSRGFEFQQAAFNTIECQKGSCQEVEDWTIG